MTKGMTKLRGLSPEEMEKEEIALREEIWKLRLQVSIGQLQNPHQVRIVKRDLARMLTVRREQEIAAAAKSGKKA